MSDPGRSIATPLEVYVRKDRLKDAAHYRHVIREHDIDRIVVGLPLHTRGTESESSRLAREWGEWLSAETGVPVVFYDERYTTVEAEEVLRSVGFKRKDRQAKRDMLAARLLLQNYLDAGCPETTPPGQPLEG